MKNYSRKIKNTKNIICNYLAIEKKIKSLWRWEGNPEKIKSYERQLAFIKKRVIALTRELETLINK